MRIVRHQADPTKPQLDASPGSNFQQFTSCVQAQGTVDQDTELVGPAGPASLRWILGTIHDLSRQCACSYLRRGRSGGGF